MCKSPAANSQNPLKNDTSDDDSEIVVFLREPLSQRDNVNVDGSVAIQPGLPKNEASTSSSIFDRFRETYRNYRSKKTDAGA